ncbi:MAG: porin [Burkholderiales bacterium]|nr:porin [Burkholderiales bacterium]MDE2275328.1 porin [Burkholderiales bacterium]
MKKSLLALAALTAFAGAASAQSSVTLFGIVDANVRSVDNGPAGKLRTQSTDGMSSSRFGVRGIEDLGGGLKAGFWLEGALGADTGGGAPSVGNGGSALTWQRRSTVSLMGDFGEIRLGRDYTPTFLNIVSFDPFNYVGVATIANTRSLNVGSAGVNGDVRANNQVSYFLPSLGGVYGQVSVSAGEGVTSAYNKSYGGRIGYAAGPINVSGAYRTVRQSGTMISDYKIASLAGSYDFGVAKINLIGEQTKYSSAKQNLINGSVVVPFGASSIILAYTRSTGNSLTVTDAYKNSNIGLGYRYSLSKRTTLYANYGRDANGNNAMFTASGAGPTPISTGFTSTGYEMGINHAF